MSAIGTAVLDRSTIVGLERESGIGSLLDLMTAAPDTGENGQTPPALTPVQSSASKTLAVLEIFTQSRESTIGVTEVAAQIGVPKSTAHRLLKTLEQHGFVGRCGARYRPGRSLFELAEATRWSEYGEFRAVAPRPLSWLFERSEAVAVHMAVLSRSDILYLEKVTSPAGTRIPSRVGGRFPATCTSLGKAMLAFSPEPVVQRVIERPMARATPYSVIRPRPLLSQLAVARDVGFAVEREEACTGILCVSAPVVVGGRAAAAVSLSVPTIGAGRLAEQRIDALGRLAIEAAAKVRRLLPIS